MGRKSSTKKKIRKIVDEKQENTKRKFSRSKAKVEAREELEEKSKNKKLAKLKETDQEPKLKKALIKFPKLPKLNIPKRQLFGGALTIIMITVLISVGYLLFQKAFRATPVAKILPAESTTSLLEINTNYQHYQLTKTFELIQNYPQYSKESLIKEVEAKIGANYQSDIQPWLGRQVAVALMKGDSGEAYPLYFAEYINEEALTKFVDQQTGLLSAEHNYYFEIIDDYLVASEGREGLDLLLKKIDEGADKLYYSKKYRRIDDNLPIQHVGFFYLDFDMINDAFIQKIPLLAEMGISMEKFGPLVKLLDAEGIVLVAMDNNFAVQSFLSLDPAVVKNAKYLPLKSSYHADLANYIDANALAFWGGENLGNQIKKFIEIMSGGDHTLLAVFDNILQNYTEKYFGQDVNFNQDILPILDKEFAFAIEKFNNQNAYKLIVEINSPQTDTFKIQELLSAFASRGAIFQPKIVEHILEDGTASREIVAVPEEISKSESIYEEKTIYYLKMGERNFGLYYAVLEDIAVFATQKEGVTSTIDIINNKTASLKSTEIFETSIEPILRNSDETSYFNFNAVLPILFEQEDLPEILTIIDAVSNGRNYFNDGIVTLNYLHIK